MLTDEAAHAWTEIFLPGYGWTPVEVTPSASGDMTASYPGFDGSALRRLIAENSTEASCLTSCRQKMTDRLSERKRIDRRRSGRDGGSRNGKRVRSFCRPVSHLRCVYRGVAGIVCLIAFCRRRVLLGRLEQADCREIFFRFTGMLKYCKIMENYGGARQDGARREHARQDDVRTDDAQEEFPESAAEKLFSVSGVSAQEIGRMREIVSRKAFGPETADAVADAGECSFVLGIYRRAAEGLYETLPWYKKVYFRFIAVFL